MEENGSCAKYQTRHLISSVDKVFALFQEEYPEVKIGWSKFDSLCPADVLLSSKIPQNVCLCKYHENVIIALEVLHKAVPTLAAYSHEVPVTFLCDKVQQEYWLNKCASCSDGRGLQRKYKLGEDDNNPVTWYVWKQTEREWLIKVVEDGTTADLFEHVKTLLPQFLEHCFVKRTQSEQYQIERNHIAKPLNKAEALMQVDFSKNYTCMLQDEVQGAHWSKKEVSLLTAAIWFHAKLHPTALVSDNLDHSKETIIPYMNIIFEMLPDLVQMVSIWSNGPSSQFKKRFMVAAVPLLERKFKKGIVQN